jgi:NitT/TauT family transport system ATP-binding protein
MASRFSPTDFPMRRGASRLTGAAPLRLGFIAVADCAPLLVGEAEGYFKRQGLDVRLSREVGWATIREKLAGGELDAAHAVCGLSLTMPLGLQAPPCEVGTAFVFNEHGNAITLAQDLWRRGVRDAADLGKLVRSQNSRLFTFATVSRTSSHYFMLCRWLQTAGLDPQRHVRIMVLPPTQMASSLKAGLIDGFCVGEPWNSLAVAEGSGWVVATSADILPRHPEKVLLVAGALLHERSTEHAALIRAMDEACRYCDEPEKRPAVAALLAEGGHLRASRELLARSLVGPFDTGLGAPRAVGDFHVFHRGEANRPTLEKARWVARELTAFGAVPPAQAASVMRFASTVWREDVYREALESSRPARRPKTTNNHQPQIAHEKSTTLA